MTRADLLRDNRRWTTVMIVVLILSVGWTFASRAPSAATTGGASPANASPREGFSAPDITLDLLGGGQVQLSELRGQPVMINLWASWCPPCRAEMPAIERVYRAYKDRGLVVLGVNTTFQDNEADAATFVQEFGLTFLILLDRNGSVSKRYQLRGLPTTFF
ncbi:MAG: TlpA disulfide reductase family protein, partial [Chloroflexota bacterium]